MRNDNLEIEETWLDELLLRIEGNDLEWLTPTETSEVQSSSSSSSNHQISKTRRRRKSKKQYRKPPFKPPFIPKIRILKRDIRRKYADMFTNVMNSHDSKLFSSFLDDFYQIDCTIMHTFPENLPVRFTSFEIRGTAMFKGFLAVNCSIRPDSVARLFDAQISKRSDESGSRVTASYSIESTAMFLPKTFNGEVVDKNAVVLEYDFAPKDFCSLERTEDFLELLQLAARPMRIKLLGISEMMLDENHRITSQVVFCNSVEISPVSESASL